MSTFTITLSLLCFSFLGSLLLVLPALSFHSLRLPRISNCKAIERESKGFPSLQSDMMKSPTGDNSKCSTPPSSISSFNGAQRRSARLQSLFPATPLLSTEESELSSAGTCSRTTDSRVTKQGSQGNRKRNKNSRAAVPRGQKLATSAKKPRTSITPCSLSFSLESTDGSSGVPAAPAPAPAPAPAAVSKPILASKQLSQINPQNTWIDLSVPPEELRPSATLTTGQCFNWMTVHADTDDGNAAVITDSTTHDDIGEKTSAWGVHNATEWLGVIDQRVISIRETSSTTLIRVVHGLTDNIVETMREYFQLHVPLAPLRDEWSAADPRLARIAKVIPGVRIIQQDPVECVFSFICSSNNNIPRITLILSRLRQRYGKKLVDIPLTNQQHEFMSLYSFPSLEELKCASEEELREMGLGYRAPYVIQTRDLLLEKGGKDYLFSLRSHPDADYVQRELIQMHGIGRKVADCIALFSLDQINAIPVDTHVQHIASRDYDPTLADAKSMTPTVYRRVGDLFRRRFSRAGWAHSLLFVAELPSFRAVLPDDIVLQMDKVRCCFEFLKKKRFTFSPFVLMVLELTGKGSLRLGQWRGEEKTKKLQEKEAKRTKKET